jgi:hypothetical protein
MRLRTELLPDRFPVTLAPAWLANIEGRGPSSDIVELMQIMGHGGDCETNWSPIWRH